ncbi:MAG: DoxX family protein [Phycisphaerales bacterium]|jgi:hypothetical protein
MIERLLDPLVSAQLLTALLLAILFLQSGLDKVVDFKGNREWLVGHFAKSPLRGQVVPMLGVITLTECAAGALALVGAVQIALGSSTALALGAAQLAALNLVMLFFGQRMAKDYAGAAALVPYFILSIGAILLFHGW